MMYKINRRYGFNIFFLLYFSFYAVSQISYHFTDRQITQPPAASDSSDYLTQKINFVLLEVLLNDGSRRDDTDNSTPSDKMLLRKKRAVLSRNNLIIKLAQLFENPCVQGVIIFSANPDCLSFQHSDKPLRGISPLYSGRSPPSI